MYVLLILLLVPSVYVATFVKDFNKDDIGKALPFLIVTGAILLLLSVLKSVGV